MYFERASAKFVAATWNGPSESFLTLGFLAATMFGRVMLSQPRWYTISTVDRVYISMKGAPMLRHAGGSGVGGCDESWWRNKSPLIGGRNIFRRIISTQNEVSCGLRHKQLLLTSHEAINVIFRDPSQMRLPAGLVFLNRWLGIPPETIDIFCFRDCIHKRFQCEHSWLFRDIASSTLGVVQVFDRGLNL